MNENDPPGLENEGALDEGAMFAAIRSVCRAGAVPHVQEDPFNESGGFLIGRPGERPGNLPLVEGTIQARYAIEREARLTFTQETWADVFGQLDRRAAEGQSAEIVGWYHSHPSSMIFLSSHDLFIQHNFFAARHQIAVVIDPHNGEFGTFALRGGEMELVDGRGGTQQI